MRSNMRQVEKGRTKILLHRSTQFSRRISEGTLKRIWVWWENIIGWHFVRNFSTIRAKFVSNQCDKTKQIPSGKLLVASFGIVSTQIGLDRFDKTKNAWNLLLHQNPWHLKVMKPTSRVWVLLLLFIHVSKCLFCIVTYYKPFNWHYMKCRGPIDWDVFLLLTNKIMLGSVCFSSLTDKKFIHFDVFTIEKHRKMKCVKFSNFCRKTLCNSPAITSSVYT